MLKLGSLTDKSTTFHSKNWRRSILNNNGLDSNRICWGCISSWWTIFYNKETSDQLHKHIPLMMIIRGLLVSLEHAEERWEMNTEFWSEYLEWWPVVSLRRRMAERIWLRIWSSGGTLWTRWRTFVSTKIPAIYLLAEWPSFSRTVPHGFSCQCPKIMRSIVRN